ncbi:hypothetical protein J2S46_005968 [Kitasatospora herbaricolor]|nr:hypothetical protein [Kitasatospora herbaricolor]
MGGRLIEHDALFEARPEPVRSRVAGPGLRVRVEKSSV